MKSTMDLLDQALKVKTPPEWARSLGLERTALHNAKRREHLSPAVAYALAEELGENAEQWALVAAVESEKDSACRQRMARRVLGGATTTAMAVLAGTSALLLYTPHCILCKVAAWGQRLARHLGANRAIPA